MPPHLTPATPSDAKEIASLRITSFSQNVLLHAQFPSPQALQDFHDVLVKDLTDAAQDHRRALMVVRDGETGSIISFAEWEVPVDGMMWMTAHSKSVWPDSCRQEYLDEYVDKAGECMRKIIRNGACYHLTFLGTHPDHRRRGAATMLLNWGLERARADNVPVYLESDIPASSLYLKLGFEIYGRFSMTLPGMGEYGGEYVYEEVCMLRDWEEEGGVTTKRTRRKIMQREDRAEDGDDEEEEDDDDIGSLDRWDSILTIEWLKKDYAAGVKPQVVVEAVYERIDVYKRKQPSVWTHLQPEEVVQREAKALLTRWPNRSTRPPLWGIPFSVKDSIDVAGVPTTIGCPPLAYTPTTTATVVQRCLDAGALFIGKTNLEQLATGLTGCRSVYGTLHCDSHEEYVVGGSSSGSVLSVIKDLVAFSLGSDTAGSIRIPAAFNGAVGFKPTKGTVSAHGLAPACKHQDCVSILTQIVRDAETVWGVCRGYDYKDHFAKVPKVIPLSFDVPRGRSRLRYRFGIPPASVLEVCCPNYRAMFDAAVKALQSGGGTLIDMDWTPFAIANDLLYNGTFVLERLTTLPDGWFDKNKELLHPVVRQVFEGALARNSSAVDVFKDLHKQAECKRAVEEILTLEVDEKIDEDDMSDDWHRHKPYIEDNVLTVMIVPTAPFHPRIEEVLKDPIGINSQLGTFTHFANVLDLTAIAVPCGNYTISEDNEEWEEETLPFGVTILAGSGLDEQLLWLARILEDELWDIHLGDD
ncbi:amidase signature domain-containing protein [Xylogone sp. PMI_703]|nr:amidase signature domain-containing protein [Xylogone sp. PMI_703]